ncbi:hypothetical protein KA517_03155 [Candidatus Gracilibacteria bacterium]|nr:hypothetical protein [Candidatus Gracilibacteria bacterium]
MKPRERQVFEHSLKDFYHKLHTVAQDVRNVSEICFALTPQQARFLIYFIMASCPSEDKQANFTRLRGTDYHEAATVGQLLRQTPKANLDIYRKTLLHPELPSFIGRAVTLVKKAGLQWDPRPLSTVPSYVDQYHAIQATPAFARDLPAQHDSVMLTRLGDIGQALALLRLSPLLFEIESLADQLQKSSLAYRLGVELQVDPVVALQDIATILQSPALTKRLVRSLDEDLLLIAELDRCLVSPTQQLQTQPDHQAMKLVGIERELMRPLLVTPEWTGN